MDELEKFEQRLKAKKQLQGNAATAKNQNTIDEVDDLDELLKEIKLKDVATKSNCDKLSTASQSTDAIVAKRTAGDGVSNNLDAETANAPPLPFALILYWFLAILNLANATFCKHL